MNQRVTKTDVSRIAHRVLDLARHLELIPSKNADGSPAALLLQQGSKANGIAWRFYLNANEQGGVTGNVLGLSSGYLGMTRQEAFDTLQTIHGVLSAVEYAKYTRKG